jgi:hypothetical protein
MGSLIKLPYETIWRSRPVRYFRGDWEAIQATIPKFELHPFTLIGSGSVNRFFKTVVRMPLPHFAIPVQDTGAPVPVGIVSRTYGLVQHLDLAKTCIKGLSDAGVATEQLKFTLGLSELDEWMSLSIALPEEYDYLDASNQKLGLTLECFNSVDGTSRLVVLFGWFRFVCSNGLVIGETKIEIKERHGRYLDLDAISNRIKIAMENADADRERLGNWQDTAVGIENIEAWADGIVSDKWGKTAAARTFHICASGQDVEFQRPSPPGAATKKPVRHIGSVPGSPDRAETRYDVAQALSYVATRRNNAEERLDWQSEIPHLISALGQVG